MRVFAAVGTLIIGFSSGGSAETTLREIEWPASLPEGVERHDDGSITVSSSSDEGLAVTLVEVDSPGVTQDRYVVKGRVRYQNVEGDGYLEMWNVFAQGRYFTRTMAEQGPMGTLSGSSEWRAFALPFDATGAEAPPERLIINVVLPGRGRVTLDGLTLVELEPGEWPSGLNDGARAGLWGGLAGAVLGTVAGVLGWLGSAGKAKGVVLNGFRVLVAVGGILLVLGVVSLAQGRPYHLYYPLLLIGAIAFIVPASLLPRLTRRYQELELRRMSALDAR